MEGKLRVVIVGAGLAGLMTGRVLRESHSVTIIERVAEKSEVGAAISLGPTAVSILDNLGFDRERVGSITWQVTRTFDRAGQALMSVDMRDVSKHTPADFLFNHRNDLWTEFLRLATAPSSELGVAGEPAKVLWGTNAVEVDIETGDVKLSDGRIIGSDLVIGADGIRSSLRPLVVGEDAFKTARPSGFSAFRFTMPAEKARKVHPEIDALDPNRPASCDIYLAMDGSNRSIVMYPCQNYARLNFVCFVPDSVLQMDTKESWTAMGSREDALRSFDDYSPFILDLLRQAEDLKLWQLRDQDPLPSYIKGRTVLIGDAAHAMTPHQAQGGTQAVEDAEAFTLFNRPDVDRSSVPTILKEIDRVRRTRASQIQNHSREAIYRKDPETIFKNNLYNNTYGGIEKCLSRLAAGEDMIPA